MRSVLAAGQGQTAALPLSSCALAVVDVCRNVDIPA